MEKKWWHSSVVYQIYPRSFMDSDGDGIGDIRGIIEKLDYLKQLGIDVIWLSPVFSSPNDDNGYDISDYRDIMTEFGTLADMEELLETASKKGIKILLDMVFNHTSDEHKWFIEAKKSKDNPYRDYYIWSDEPNELTSLFSGSAWEWDEDSKQYYLHIFSKKQPDLNVANPKVRQELIDILNFWIEKGVGGFRFDVLELIGKQPDKLITANGPMLHPYIQQLNRESFGKKELLTVGECWCADEEIAKMYSGEDRDELSMVFQFQHMTLDEEPGKGKWHLAPLDFLKLKKTMAKWQTALESEGWNSLFWNNHDLPRIVSRFGDDREYRVESAKMLAILLHGMKGTPYIYQGEEIGMTNVRFDSIEEYPDIETRNMYQERMENGESEEEIMKSIYAKGSDNARTPMQWNGQKGAGFTTGTPWIGINENYRLINVEEALKDPNSIFYCYQKLIQLRKANEVLVYGSFELLLPEHPSVFAYRRKWRNQVLLVVANFKGETEQINLGEGVHSDIWISNYERESVDLSAITLKPYEAFILKER